MNKKSMILACVATFIVGTISSWVAFSIAHESQLADIQAELADRQLRIDLCESELSNLQKHCALKLNYDPSDAQAFHLIDEVFNVTFTSREEYLIIGNITNLTHDIISKVVLFIIPRYPDGSLGSLPALIGETVEILESNQTKEFTLVSTLEENQPFELLIVY